MKRVVNYNPGMARRVTHTFTFPDYSITELVAIMRTMATADHYNIVAADEELVAIIGAKFTIDQLSQHNAGFSSRLYSAAKGFADGRIAELIMRSEGDVDDSVLTSLLPSDFEDVLRIMEL